MALMTTATLLALLGLALVPTSHGLAAPLGRYARSRRLRVLREDLADAIRSQNFALASRLKTERDGLTDGDRERALRGQLARAVAQEDFATATTVRDQLRSAQRASASADRLLFLSPDGKRMWVRSAELLLDEMPEPSGEGTVLLQPDALAPGSYRLLQPTWSPSCACVAATLVVADSGLGGELVIFDGIRGGELARVALPTAPFYYMWSTDERYVTCLGANQGRIVLLAVEVRTGEVQTLARGAPMFYALSGAAGDRRLVAHNGGANALQLLGDYGPPATVASRLAPVAPEPARAQPSANPQQPQPQQPPAQPQQQSQQQSQQQQQAWRTLCAPAGGFQSPWWSRWRAPDGGTQHALVFAERSKLVCVDPEARVDGSARRRTLFAPADQLDGTDEEGMSSSPFLVFVVARGAQAIALLRDPSETELLLLTPSLRADRPCLLDVGSRVMPRAEPVDLNGALPRGETLSSVGAFWFSPGGRWLLVLAQTSRPSAELRGAGAGSARWRWVVYDCEERRPFGATPSGELSVALAQQYVPFFTQYAQSVSPFSPDGGAFCYVTDEGGFVATLHPERAELAARVTVTPLPNKPERPEVLWWSGPVTDAVDDVDMDLNDRRW